MVDPSVVRIRGPLAPYVQGVWSELRRRGYSPLSSLNLLRVMAHLSRWLERVELPLAELSPEKIVAFFEARRQAGYTQFLTPRSLTVVLGQLEGAGFVLSSPSVSTPSPLDELMDEYMVHLQRERNLAAQVVRSYAAIARRFLSGCYVQERTDLEGIRAEAVTSFVLRESRRSSTGHAKLAVTALRSLLRYLYVSRKIAGDLAGAAPAIAGWRLSGLPKALDAEQVQQLLRRCDRRTLTGRRDYAVMLVMVRLGLRAGEVAALELEDLDWVCGELVIRGGKGRRQDTLPLPEDVGAAIARYLRLRRPCTSCRRIFLRIRAPQGQLTRAAVSAIVAHRSLRAGLGRIGAHRLRHTAATQMLRRGGSLDEVAQVLRHRSHDTTAIYAKVDRLSLRAVAQPWPGGAS